MSDGETVIIPRNHNTTVQVYHLENPEATTDRPLCNRGADDWVYISKREAKNRYGATDVCADCRIKANDGESYRHKQGKTACQFCGAELAAETLQADHLTTCPAFEQHRRPPEAGI